MGGVQAREGALAEVHAVRGGQLILRVAPSQTTSGSTSGLASSSKLSIVIPYEGKCYILEQSMDVLEKIFLRLTPRELALLCLTCRTMNLIVSQFLDHFCASYNLRAKLKSFYELNSNLLLPKELVLKDRLECNSRHELLLYSAMRQFIGHVRRVSLCDVQQFDHSQEPEYLVKERDVALKRDVMVLKSVCWLYFRHTFTQVKAGRYILQLRVRLSNARWETSQRPQLPAIVRVMRKNVNGLGKTEMVSQKVDPHWWGRIEAHQLHSDLEHASFVFDRDSDWLFMRLDPIELKEEADLEFEFDDTRNANAKHGMIWDFLELRSMVKMMQAT